MKNGCFFLRTRKYLTSPKMRYLCKSQIRSEMVYCCQHWVRSDKSSLSGLDSVKMFTRHCGRWNISNIQTPITMQASCYSIFMADVQTSSIHLFHKFKPLHTTYKASNLPHSLHVLLLSSKFSLDIFLTRTVVLWNILPKKNAYNLNIFKSW